MDERKDIAGMLDLMILPGFCVKDNQICALNAAAKRLFLTEGMPINDLLLTGSEEYAAFTSGCLYLTLSIGGESWGATVSRLQDQDIFLLEQEENQTELQAMALAARELREPLTNVLIAADRLSGTDVSDDDPSRQQLARLNRGLYQMLRILSNMSDAARSPSATRQENMDIDAALKELFEKASDLAQHAGVRLSYTGPEESILCLGDREQLERAVLNLLSNAIKFTPKEGSVEASLQRRGRQLILTVRDSGSGIADEVLNNLFHRYLRQPGLEDSRFGIGLGMVLVRKAAAAHGGTVLVDRIGDGGTRVTMTLAIRHSSATMLRSPILRVDYAGERDHCLLEFSETLPAHLYEKN
jgi:signal transduction histidine kinase